MSALSIASYLSDFSPRRIPDEQVIILPAAQGHEEADEDLSPEQVFEEAIDIELQLKQAFEAGREAGRAEADALYEAEKQRLQRAHEEEMAGLRTATLSETADLLMVGLLEGLGALEATFSGQMAELIAPLMAEHFADKAVSDFAGRAAACLPAAMGMEISGPRDLLDALQKREGFVRENFLFIEAEQVELQLRLDERVVATRLGPLLDELKALIR
ncbi:hypothetical protein [Phyllobacterium leguminum]|uniref:Flagellar assembly protein FliH n=1 Tax=Phyllobacterium leguminum TaxID=314237 RepID=A0A318T0A5_9HYPH|nr:hypothetical protein [Phyllobacterium leguminum]PYE87693.1 hypothetical protein C7477_11140 [Phyllobacterium leguminum]